MTMHPLNGIDYLVVHHSASSAMSTTPEMIRQWHVDDNGWDDVGYHWLIDWKGDLIAARPLPMGGAHVKGHNAHSLGVCVIGDNTSGNALDRWQPAQERALWEFVRTIRTLIPTLRVLGHRDLAEGTECPGLDIKDLFFGKL